MRVLVAALKSGRTESPQPHLLLIEEINRAKVAAVFGEVFQLLDRSDSGASEYEIHATEDVRKYLISELGKSPDSLRIPDNMFIWATMNSADQGVYPMDTAFKRRWSFEYIGIDENDAEVGGIVALGRGDHARDINWNQLRKAINDTLAVTYNINEDKLLGPYFLSKRVFAYGDNQRITDPERFIAAFKSKVIMYLYEDAAKSVKRRLFEGCDASKYSSVCSAFDETGIEIFGADLLREVTAMGFISRYVREQKRYTKNEIKCIFDFSESEAESFIRRLKSFGIMKAVKNTAGQRDLSDLSDADIEIADDAGESSECFYVFTYVGVLTIGDRVIKCFPKYITQNDAPDTEMKQVIRVLRRYGSKEQIVNLYNGDGQSSSFNILAVMLFLLEDYHQYGAYINSEDIVEVNGEGPILWGQTIDNGFAVISNNRPYYVDIYTHRSINDEQDFFHRLHRCIVSESSRQLRDAGLIDLFDLVEADISNEVLDDFGDKEYILYRLHSELGVQFNTHKQTVLKTLYAFIVHHRTLAESEGISMYGTNSFNLVWEDVCAEVFNNKLKTQLRHLPLPHGLAPGYDPKSLLIDIIEKPQWQGWNADGTAFVKTALETLTPDLINIYEDGGSYTFVIFDAKYYCIQLENNKPLRGQPGVGDVTKQYLYQLAYQNFIAENHIEKIRNCFLIPSEQDVIIDLGIASITMLSRLGLEDIQIRLLPTAQLYDKYLSHKSMDASCLRL